LVLKDRVVSHRLRRQTHDAAHCDIALMEGSARGYFMGRQADHSQFWRCRALHREPIMSRIATDWRSLLTQVREHKAQLSLSLRVTIAAVLSFMLSPCCKFLCRCGQS
jgi:hypothetical protein